MRSEVIFDAPELSNRLAALEERMGVPTFWDDNDAAQEVIQEVKRLRGWLDPYRAIESKLRELEEFGALLEEVRRAAVVFGHGDPIPIEPDPLPQDGPRRPVLRRVGQLREQVGAGDAAGTRHRHFHDDVQFDRLRQRGRVDGTVA